MDMELFFRATRGKMREYQWTGDSWKETELGHYTVQLLNEFLGEELEALREKTDLEDEKTLITYMWPLYCLALALVAGRKVREMEMLPQREDADIMTYFNTTRTELWDLWRRVDVLPFYAGLGRTNAFGWLAKVENTLEAATVELVLAFMHGIKRPFGLCVKHLTFYHEECPRCKPEAKVRSRFLGLLRQHKYRLQSGGFGLKPEIAKYVIGEIKGIQEAARKEKALKSLIARYTEVCRENDLPTAWVRQYRSLLGERASGRGSSNQ